MKSRALRLVLCAASVAGAIHLAADRCAAGGCGYGYGWIPGIQYNIYGTDYIPYFARHPPVYYSYPVARTYGYSPWAYPPGVMTPELAPAPEPVTVINPHVPRVKSRSTDERTAQVQPLRIRNPFVESAVAEIDDADSHAPVAVEVRKPQVVYPAKVE